jgi:aryl-alcohol dehydrogenase-like predicted oxidoreductase
MKTRTLGRNGPEVSAIGFGAMVLSPGIYSPVNDEASIQTIHRLLDLGINFIDTAERYGNGHNERLVGRAIRDRRGRVVLATKFGAHTHEDGSHVRGLGRRGAVRKALDASLQRLGLDFVDLYYLHRLDPATSIEETVGAMADLVHEGKVRYLGLSEVSAALLRRAHAVHPITAVQSEYSLFSREPEAEVFPTCRELGVGFVPYSPLGRGLLTGHIRRPEDLKPDDWRRTVPRFQGENLRRNLQVVEALEVIAKRKGITLSQLALAWILHQGDDLVPIPGSRHAKNMEQNARAADVVLDATELEEINRAARGVAGERGDELYLETIRSGQQQPAQPNA